MTTKEWEGELKEILDFKISLTEKITHNLREVTRLIALEREEKDPKIKKTLKKEIAHGERIISMQTTKRTKLSAEKIAKQLGIKTHMVRYREHIYSGKAWV